MRCRVVAGLLLATLLAGCGLFRRAPAPEESRPGAVQTGTASWYGPGFHGNRTTSGEVYDQNELTAAHQTLPLGTRVSVTNLANGREVDVRINDRGPFAKGRILDLSYAAARTLGMIGPGTTPVRLEVLSSADIAFAPLAYTLQVGSFVDHDRAVRLKGQLAERFNDVYVATQDMPGATFYRVRVGKFSRREDAAQYARSVNSFGLPVIIVEDGPRQ